MGTGPTRDPVNFKSVKVQVTCDRTERPMEALLQFDIERSSFRHARIVVGSYEIGPPLDGSVVITKSLCGKRRPPNSGRLTVSGRQCLTGRSTGGRS